MLQVELVMAATAGNIRFGNRTDIGVLCTLWDRTEKRVADRFTVLGNVQGDRDVANGSGVIAHSVRRYRASRLQGKELDAKEAP